MHQYRLGSTAQCEEGSPTGRSRPWLKDSNKFGVTAKVKWEVLLSSWSNVAPMHISSVNRGLKISATFTQCEWRNCSLLPLGGVTPAASTPEQRGRRHTRMLEGGAELSDKWSGLSTGLRNESTGHALFCQLRIQVLTKEKLRATSVLLKHYGKNYLLYLVPCMSLHMRRQKAVFFLHLPHQITIQYNILPVKCSLLKSFKNIVRLLLLTLFYIHTDLGHLVTSLLY